MQCGVQWAGRGAVRGMRTWGVQGGERVIVVRYVLERDVSECERGDGVRDLPGRGILELSAGECGGGCVLVQCGVHWTGRGAMHGVLAWGVQGDQRVVILCFVRSGGVPEHECWDGVRWVSVWESLELAPGE